MTYRLDPIGHEPVETLHEEKKAKHENKWDVKLVSKDGERQ